MLSSKREKFQYMEGAIGRRLSFLSPNSWTAISLLLAIAAAYSIALGNFLTGALLFVLAALCDAIDGAVARFKKQASKKGAYLDTIADRYVEFFIIIGLFFAALPDFIVAAKLWLLIYAFGSMMTTYAKAAAKEKGLIKEEMKAGLIGRGERMILLFIGLILAAFNPVYLTYDIILLAVLTNITALQRIAITLRGQ